jgi:glycerol-3-phosphate dehydrogenase
MSHYFSKKEAMETFATLAQQNAFQKTLKGAVVYYDGQMNDSQLNVVIAWTAALVGAVVLNHAEAISLKKDEVTGNVTVLL